MVGFEKPVLVPGLHVCVVLPMGGRRPPLVIVCVAVMIVVVVECVGLHLLVQCPTLFSVPPSYDFWGWRPPGSGVLHDCACIPDAWYLAHRGLGGWLWWYYCVM